MEQIEMARKGGAARWKGKTKAERSAIMAKVWGAKKKKAKKKKKS